MSDTPLSASKLDPRTARNWAEVDLDRLASNAHTLRRHHSNDSGDDVMAVVKADAYGHGAARIAVAAQAAGIVHFGVATLAEALELRRAGIRRDIYLLSPFLPAEADTVIRADLIPMLSSPEQLTALEAAGGQAPLPARCVLKLDTGMGRSGATPDIALALWRRASEAATVRVVGVATHFSSADELDDEGQAATDSQTENFYELLRALWAVAPPDRDDGRGGRGVWLSLANSPGALLPRDVRQETPGVRGYLTRTGLLLYGIEPYRGALTELPDLAPVLSWQVRVTLLKDLPAGTTVGYGRTCTLTRPSRIATLAAGYADGLFRRLSNCGSVLLNGQRLPIVGRVSMDQCQVDVTDAHTPVTVGDVAILIGSNGDETQTVLDLAERTETTPHEPTCALTRRVPRIYRGG